MAKILLINPNSSLAVLRQMVAIASPVSRSSTAWHGVCAPSSVPLITTDAELAAARIAVAGMARRIDADGVIVAAFGDPGADELSGALSIPVVGIGAASMRAASRDGRRFSVATTTPMLDRSIRARAAALGLGDQLVSIRYTAGDPRQLTSDPQRLRDSLAEAIGAAIGDGAEAVVIGGGPLAMAARSLSGVFAVPIIEPIPEAVRAVEAALSLPV